MNLSLTPLDKIKHRDLKLSVDPTFSFIQKHCMIPIYASEFYYVSNNFPIFFVKSENNSGFECVALTGFEPGENLIFSRKKPATTYIPQQLKHQPFYFMPHPENSEQMIICVDESSPQLGQNNGDPLFNHDQTPTSTLQNVLDMLNNQSKMKSGTTQFINALLHHALLEEAKLDITSSLGEKKRVNGLYRVSRELLQLLPETIVIEMHRNGFLTAIHAHLNSHGQIPRLLALRGVAS